MSGAEPIADLDLRYAWAKLQNAEDHLNRLKGLFAEWVSESGYTVSSHPDGPALEHVVSVEIAKPAPVIRYGAAIGDVCYNAISSLDALVFEISRHHEDFGPIDAGVSSWPFDAKVNQWGSYLGRALKFVSEPHLSVIREWLSYKPDRAEPALPDTAVREDHPIRILGLLRNYNTHRVVLAAGGGMPTIDATAHTAGGDTPVTFSTSVNEWFPLKGKQQVYKVATNLASTLKVNNASIKPTISIAFTEPNPPGETFYLPISYFEASLKTISAVINEVATGRLNGTSMPSRETGRATRIT